MTVKCPKCRGCKGIYGKSATGHPATLPCDRCNATGEMDYNALTEQEKVPSVPLQYERDDI